MCFCILYLIEFAYYILFILSSLLLDMKRQEQVVLYIKKGKKAMRDSIIFFIYGINNDYTHKHSYYNHCYDHYYCWSGDLQTTL